MVSFSSEEWKDIPNYEGYYQVSNKGRIKSVSRTVTGSGVVPIKTIKEKILSPHLRGDKTKYPTVLVSKHGQKKKLVIHQIVLETFKGPRPSPKHVARHLNDITIDNRSDNLEWGTQSQNMKDKFNNGYRHSQKVFSLGEEIFIQCDKRPGSIIAKELGVNKSTINRLKKQVQITEDFSL